MSRNSLPLSEHLQQSVVAEAVLLHDPVLNDTVAGLGEVSMVDVRVTGRGTDQQPFRVHRLFTVELDDYKHALEITDPAEGTPRYAVFSNPGLTEHIRGGIRKKMHSHTSYAHPQARVVSVESDGIGSVGDRFSWSERHGHGLDAMGERRQRIARICADRLPVILQGTSMGTVINHRTAEHNLTLPDQEQANIQGQVWLTPALVDPSRVLVDMGLRFPFNLGWSFGKSFAKRPAHLVELGKLAGGHDFDVDDLPTLGWQTKELLHGTSLARTRAVVSRVRTVVIAGEDDSLKQQQAFEDMSQEFPDDQLKFIHIPGKGHELGVVPKRACLKMQKEGQHLVDTILAASLDQAANY